MADAALDDWAPVPAPPAAADDWQPARGPNFTESVGRDISGDISDEGRVLTNAVTGQRTLPSTALQTMGNVMAPVGQAAGEAIKRIPGYDTAAAAVKSADEAGQRGVQPVADYVNSKGWGEKLGDAMMNFRQNHPELAEDADALGKIFGTEGTISGAALAKDAFTKAASLEAANNSKNIFTNNESGGYLLGSNKAAKNFAAAQARNESYIQGLNDSADNMKSAYGVIYDKAQNVSQGTIVNEPRMKATVDKFLEDMKEDPAHNGTQGTSQAYRDLTSVSNSFDEDGNIPLDSLTLLKKRVNDLYSRDMSETRGAIYNQLNTQLKGAISRAKAANPEWGQLMDSGNNLFLNYKKTFADDVAGNKKWSLDDKEDYQRAQQSTDPTGAPAMESTRDKVNNITQINSLAQYESMLRKLPPELHDQFTQDVIAANKENSPGIASRISAYYNIAKGSPYGFVKGISKLLPDAQTGIDPSLAQKFPHVNDAIDFHAKAADDAFDRHLAKMQAIQDKMDQAAGGPRLLPPPAAQRALPPPAQPDFISDWRGDAAPPSNFMSNTKGETWPTSYKDTVPPQDNSVLRPADVQPPAVRTRGDAREPATGTGNWYNNFMRQHANRPVVSTDKMDYVPPSPAKSTLQDISGSKDGDMEEQLNELSRQGKYARGGVIRLKPPTEAQKKAGNYQKLHVAFHGLRLALENPKGSVRSGQDANGKKWSTTMPDHYGYIKGTRGADKDHIDCYLGPNERSTHVYVIDQHKLGGGFDEHKIFLGFSSKEDAISSYKKAFSDGKGAQRIGHVMGMSIHDLKKWLQDGNTRNPIKSHKEVA